LTKLRSSKIFRIKAASALLVGLCMLLSGIGIGWLIGLSVSPVLYILITSIVTIAAGITSTLTGLEAKADKANEDESASTKPTSTKRDIQINPLPLTTLIIGLVIGTSVGVYARTNEWLGPNIEKLTEKWKDTEYSKRDIARVIFAQLHGTIEAAPQSTANPAAPSTTGSTETTTGARDSTQPLGGGSSTTGATRNQNVNSGGQTIKMPQVIIKPNNSPNPSSLGVLFSVTEDERARICSSNDATLSSNLCCTSDTKLNQQASQCGENISCLRRLKEEVCSRR